MTTSPQTATLLPMTVHFPSVSVKPCPSGVYRIEFFGLRLDERGYQFKEAA